MLVFLFLFLPFSSLADVQTDIQVTGLQYFLDHAHPVTGLVRDRAENFRDTPATNRLASLAATGFGLAVITHASTVGRVDSAWARDYVLRTLRFCRDRVPRYRGWFVHFADWETGRRAPGSEYSPIDTALFMAGALYAGQVFGGEAREVAAQLHEDMDFPAFLTDEGRRPRKLTLSLSWTPERGYSRYQWEAYSEQLILLVLGMGHPTRPLPTAAWRAWRRDYSRVHGKRVMGAGMPLFIHQYSQLFVDFRRFSDGHANYFHNGVLATRLHRARVGEREHHRAMRAGFWGLSAGDSPDGYRAPDPRRPNGTVCVGCALASAMFLPTEVLADAQAWRDGVHGTRLWGRYGFSDGVNLDRGWYAPMVIGITVGPAYLSLANLHASSSVWKDFMAVPAIRRGLARASKH